MTKILKVKVFWNSILIYCRRQWQHPEKTIDTSAFAFSPAGSVSDSVKTVGILLCRQLSGISSCLPQLRSWVWSRGCRPCSFFETTPLHLQVHIKKSEYRDKAHFLLLPFQFKKRNFHLHLDSLNTEIFHAFFVLTFMIMAYISRQ